MLSQSIVTKVIFYTLVIFLPVMMAVLSRRPEWWQYLFALFLGLVTSWIEVASVGVQLPALLLIVFGMFMGFARPKSAWLSGLLLGVWIPLSHSAAVIVGLEPYQPGQTISSLLALLFAFAGTYLGVLVSRISKHMRHPVENQKALGATAAQTGMGSLPH